MQNKTKCSSDGQPSGRVIECLLYVLSSLVDPEIRTVAQFLCSGAPSLIEDIDDTDAWTQYYDPSGKGMIMICKGIWGSWRRREPDDHSGSKKACWTKSCQSWMSGDLPDDEVAGRDIPGRGGLRNKGTETTQSLGSPPWGQEHILYKARVHLIKNTHTRLFLTFSIQIPCSLTLSMTLSVGLRLGWCDGRILQWQQHWHHSTSHVNQQSWDREVKPMLGGLWRNSSIVTFSLLLNPETMILVAQRNVNTQVKNTWHRHFSTQISVPKGTPMHPDQQHQPSLCTPVLCDLSCAHGELMPE